MPQDGYNGSTDSSPLDEKTGKASHREAFFVDQSPVSSYVECTVVSRSMISQLLFNQRESFFDPNVSIYALTPLPKKEKMKDLEAYWIVPSDERIERR